MITYDTIIVGAGLSGLWLSHRLRASGEKVALLEAREHLGGRYRHQSVDQPYGSPNVEFYPATNEVVDLLRWAQSLAPLPFQITTTEHRPQIFDDGKWKAFAGFGETNFQSVGELGAFAHAHEAVVEPGLEHLVRALVEQLPLEAQTLAQVTAIKFNDAGHAEVTVNGDKTVVGEKLIFTAHPTRLNDLIEGETLAAKHRTRLAKMVAWTTVTLELNHEPPLEADAAVRVFNHNAKDFEPVVGRVFGSRSKWMTLVPDEREMEHEFIGQCIRHIKRQLKRAYPLALDGELKEKIYVQANAFGQNALKTKDGIRFPELKNLYLANHGLGTLGGILGSLEMARAVETQILGAGAAVPKSTGAILG